jgi:hypothetical protein
VILGCSSSESAKAAAYWRTATPTVALAQSHSQSSNFLVAQARRCSPPSNVEQITDTMKRLTRLRSSRLFLESSCAARITRRPAKESASRFQRDGQRSFSASVQPRSVLDRLRASLSEKTELKNETDLLAEDSRVRGQEVEEIPDDAILEDGVEATSTGANTVGVPPPRKPAERPENITDPDYIPAETGDDLEVVGGFEDWWDKDSNWNAALNYRGFGPQEKVRDAASLQVLARAAVVEALAVQQWYGADAKTMLVGKWEALDRNALERTMAVGVTSGTDGIINLTGDLQSIVLGLEPSEGKGAQLVNSGDFTSMIIAPEEAEATVKTMDGSWQDVSLADEWLKFAVSLSMSGNL